MLKASAEARERLEALTRLRFDGSPVAQVAKRLASFFHLWYHFDMYKQG